MYIYILCLCGNLLGDKAKIFDAIRRDHISELFPSIEENSLEFKLALMQEDFSYIFDIICITRECCKSRISSQVTLKEEY